MSVYFVLHIPKTAGITIAEHLAAHCAAGDLWRPAAPRLFDRSLSLPDLDRVRVVIPGHYRGRSLERYFPARNIRRVVLLRDPVGLQVSYYNWRMMRFLARGQGTYSFALHLRTLPRNFMTNFLLRFWLEVPTFRLLAMSDGEKLELVQRHFAQFWFVGAYTDCAKIVAALASELDLPPVAAARNGSDELRSIVDWRPLRASELTTAQRTMILGCNPLDQLLWETWHDAGFAAANVHAVPWHRPRSIAALGHAAMRPALEAVRLWRRGPARRPDIAEIGLPAPTDTRADAAGATMNVGALLEALERTPDDTHLWRSLLTRYRRKAPREPLPAMLIGKPEELHDATLCALKGETFLCCGDFATAQRFLRFAPALAHTRRQAADLTVRCALLDPAFQTLLRRADASRDKQAWREAAHLYREALNLYPGHHGYMIQYAHCLRALGDNSAAEIYYRSARALGAPFGQIEEGLRAVTARNGNDQPVEAVRRIWPGIDSKSILDDPPTRADVDVANYVIGNAAADSDRILAILRSARSIRDVFRIIVVERYPGADDATSAALTDDALQRFPNVRRELAIDAMRAIATPPTPDHGMKAALTPTSVPALV